MTTLAPIVGALTRRAPASRNWHAFAIAAISIVTLSPSIVGRLALYDGGISASAGTFILHGQVPYRDFWMLYGPASGALVALVTAIFGPSLVLLRVLGLVSLGTAAGLGYVFLRRYCPHSVAAVLSLASVAPIPFVLGAEPSAWVLSIVFVLAAAVIRVGSPTRSGWAGLCLGVAVLFRLDVGAYGMLAFLLIDGRRSLLLGFSIVVIPFGLLVAATTPFESIYEQLIWYPLVGPRQFRGGPTEAITETLIESVPLAVIPRLAILAAGLRIVFARERRTGVVVMTAFAALCQLQTQGRGDYAHLAQAAMPAILLLGAWFGEGVEFVRTRTVVVASAAASAIALGMLVFPEMTVRPSSALQDVDRTVAVVRANSGPDEPIFVGLTSHRHTVLNPLLIYYLADRRAGVHQAMFNPGITNTETTQRAMATSLQATGTRILVLDSWSAQIVEASNESRVPGSSFLDEYIEANYAPACESGPYEILVRRGTGLIDCAGAGSAD